MKAHASTPAGRPEMGIARPDYGINRERNAEIVRRRDGGQFPWQIADDMDLTRNVVLGVCWRANLKRDDASAAMQAGRPGGRPAHRNPQPDTEG